MCCFALLLLNENLIRNNGLIKDMCPPQCLCHASELTKNRHFFGCGKGCNFGIEQCTSPVVRQLSAGNPTVLNNGLILLIGKPYADNVYLRRLFLCSRRSLLSTGRYVPAIADSCTNTVIVSLILVRLIKCLNVVSMRNLVIHLTNIKFRKIVKVLPFLVKPNYDT